MKIDVDPSRPDETRAAVLALLTLMPEDDVNLALLQWRICSAVEAEADTLLTDPVAPTSVEKWQEQERSLTGAIHQDEIDG
jgi:hypothetical protein